MKKIIIQVFKNTFLFVLLSSFLLISLLPASGAGVFTSAGANSLYGLESTPEIAEGYDYILVIDESGSMKENDPANLRKDAAKLFVYLAETLNKGNRVLVSGFGQSTNIYLPLTDINGNEDEISSAIDRIQSSQALTDMKGALEEIKKELDFRTDKKKTAVIFLTDGSLTLEDIPPETEKSGEPSRERPGKPVPGDDSPAIPDDTTGTDTEDKTEKTDSDDHADFLEAEEDSPVRELDYLETYKKELIDLCRQYSSSGIVIHPIAFTGEAEVQILEQMADITGGICYKPQEAKDLRVSFIDILRNLTSRFIKIEEQQGPSAITGDFNVGSYIKELVVIGLKNSYTQNPSIKIFDPQAFPVSYEQYFEENIFKIGKLKNPASGKWNYEVRGDAIFVFDIINSIPAEPRFDLYIAGAQVPLEIDISGVLNNESPQNGSNGQEDAVPADDSILKDFNITAKIQDPDGKSVVSENINDEGNGSDSITRDGIFSGIFQDTSGQGYYDINYSITHLPTGAVSNKILSFSTIKYPVSIELIEPSEDFYQPGSEIDIVIKVEKTEEAEVGNNFIFNAEVSSAQGVVAKDLMLLDDGLGADMQAGDGLFSATFTGIASEGIYSVECFVTRPEAATQAACAGINAEFHVQAYSSADLQIDNNLFTGEPAFVKVDLNNSGLFTDDGNLNDVALSYTLTLPDGTEAQGSLYDNGKVANADKTPGDGIFSVLLDGLDQTGKYDIKVEGAPSPENTSGTDGSSRVFSINAEGSFYKYFELKNMPGTIEFMDGVFNAEVILTIASAATDDAKLSIGQVEITDSDAPVPESSDSRNEGTHQGDSGIKSAVLKNGVLKAMSDNNIVVEIVLDKNIEAGQYSLQIPVTINGASTKIVPLNIKVSQSIPPYMIILVIGAGIILAAAIIVLIYFLYIRPKRRGY